MFLSWNWLERLLKFLDRRSFICYAIYIFIVHGYMYTFLDVSLDSSIISISYIHIITPFIQSQSVSSAKINLNRAIFAYHRR